MSCIVSSRNGRFKELKCANVINSTFDMDLFLNFYITYVRIIQKIETNTKGSKKNNR